VQESRECWVPARREGNRRKVLIRSLVEKETKCYLPELEQWSGK